MQPTLETLVLAKEPTERHRRLSESPSGRDGDTLTRRRIRQNADSCVPRLSKALQASRSGERAYNGDFQRVRQDVTVVR